MISITYRTDGAWGTGVGRGLTAPEIDTNFYNIVTVVDDLVAHPIAPKQIASITLDGTDLNFHLDDGSVIGPLPFPAVAWSWRGNFVGGAGYSRLDWLNVPGSGVYLVLEAHTAGTTFNPDLLVGSDPAYLQISEAQAAGIAGLADVTLSSLTDGQALVWNATDGKWENTSIPGLGGLSSLSDVLLTSPADKQRLAYDAASSKWKNAADTLSGLSDVVLTSLADTQVLAWHAATGKWVNVNAGSGGGGGSLSALSDVALTSPASGDALHYNGTNWVNGPDTLAGSSDVVLTSLTGNQYLRWDSTTSKWVNASLPGLAGLSDVALAGLTDGQVIAWHAATSKFINATAVGGSGATNLAALSDVAIASPAVGQQLIFNGTYWQNVSISGSVFTGIDLVNGNNNSATEVIEGHGFLDDGAGNNAAWGLLQFKQARGTLAAPTATLTGDRLGTMQWIGRGATGIAPYASAEIWVEAAENFTDLHQGVRFKFITTTIGTVATLHHVSLTIEDDGGLVVGSATGGSQGDGTVNAEGYFVNGTAVVTLSTLALASATDVAIASPAGNQLLYFNGAAGKWENESLSALIDAAIGSTRGAVLYRGASGWAILVPGTTGQFLKTNGAGADPAWAAGASGSTTLAGDTDVSITSAAANDFLVYDSTASAWKNQRQHYDIAAYVPGTMANSQVLLMHRFSKAVTLPANFGAYLGRTSQAGGSANATASTVINVDKAATATPNTFSNVGTITIAAGGVTPTFASSGGTAISFAAGDVLRLVGPSTADATLAGFYATLCGYET